MSRWALARRDTSKPDEIAYYLVHAPLQATAPQLVRIAGSHWAIEECFQAARNECGLDQYEVRRYVGWDRQAPSPCSHTSSRRPWPVRPGEWGRNR